MKKLLLLLTIGLGSQLILLAQVPDPPIPVTPPPPASDDLRGVFIADGTYSNAFFGLSLQVPSSFTILNKGETETYTKAGADKFKGNTSQTDKAVEAAVNRTIYLLMVTTKPPGSLGNAVLELQIVKEPSAATANMIMAETMKLLTSTGKVRVVDRLKDTQFGGKSFVGIELESTTSQTMKHRIYMVIIKGYAMIIGLTFTKTSEEDMAVFDGMLNSFAFKAK
ncbi:MAG: hypothetical protein ACKVQJ_06695 [Pyrinomonadaceae bacterium]